MLIFAVRLIAEQDGKMLFLRQTKKNGGRFSLIGGNVEETEYTKRFSEFTFQNNALKASVFVVLSIF
jgi:hypothetical protein